MSARLPRKETGPHAGHELNTDWNKKKTDLEMERDGYVYRVLEIDFPDSLPPNFYRFRITYPKREWE